MPLQTQNKITIPLVDQMIPTQLRTATFGLG